MVFDGRVDGRYMQSALNSSTRSDDPNQYEKNDDLSNKDKFRKLQNQYQGCVFDYSSDLKLDPNDGGFWFDFMADCGDGFNPSYQIARMLAQPKIDATKCGENLELPRGCFLINGGDLAYPNPTELRYVLLFIIA